MKDRICEPNPKVAVSCQPPSSLWRNCSTEKFQSRPKMASTTSQGEHHVEYMLYMSLCLTGEQNWPNIARWNRITLDLSYSRDGWVFSWSTKFNYDRVALWKCQWVFKHWTLDIKVALSMHLNSKLCPISTSLPPLFHSLLIKNGRFFVNWSQ